MKLRIVAVPLAVALGLWSVGLTFAQAQETASELIAPSPELDPVLQSELPLQGSLDGSPFEASIAEKVAPEPAAAAPKDTHWVYALRHRFIRAPWLKIGLAFGLLCVLFAAGWTLKSAFRRRARRAYRRLPRSSGGTRLQSLEEVVASVQFANSKDSSRRPLQEPATGRE